MRKFQSIQASVPQGGTLNRGHFSLLALCLLLFSATKTEAVIPYEHGDPTNFEQYMLELLNRARMDPSAEGIRLSKEIAFYAQSMRWGKPEFFINLRKEFASYPKAPPLAFNPKLLKSAQGYSQEMAEGEISSVWLGLPAEIGNSFFFFDDFKGNWILIDLNP